MIGRKPKLTWKAIPVVLLFGIGVPLGVIVIGRGVDWMFNLSPFPPFPLNLLLGAMGLLLGYIFGLCSIYNLYQAGSGLPWGDVDPEAQSSKLVTRGLYRYTRNPMIFGTFCLLMGFGFVVQSVTALTLFPSMLLAMLYIWVKNREEPALEKRFGQEYIAYKRNTPFLFPRPWRLISKKEP